MTTQCRVTSVVAASLLAVMVGSSAFGQVQNKDQQKCTNTLNKDTCKVAATQGKENSGCVKAGTKGTATAGCLTADSKGKVATATGKTSADETKNVCLTTNLPPFGYSNASNGNAAALAAELALFHDTYGTIDPTTVISTAKADGKCQSAVTKDLEKVIATKWKQYVACKKNALKVGANTVGGLEACVGVPAPGTPDANSIQKDPKGKIAGAVNKLNADIGKDCIAPVVIATDFPGNCSGASTGTLAACLDTQAECRICLALNAIDRMNVDCDLFDDGTANGSCTDIIPDHTCNLLTSVPASGSPSHMTLFTESVGNLNFNLIGSLKFGGLDKYATCQVASLSPVNIIGIGFVCINPGGPCPIGQRYCGPGGAGSGPQLGIDSHSDGEAGTCTSNTDCATTCTTLCGGATNVATAGCVGFCSGSNPANQACTSDAACLPSNQACNGPDPVPAPVVGTCQCSCTNTAAHGPSDPGDVQCSLGSNITVETAAPCNGTDTLIAVGNTCIPVSTEAASGDVTNANFNAGVGTVPVPPATNNQTGTQLSCATVDASTTSGQVVVGAVNFFGSALGDLSVSLKSTCQ